MATEVTRTENSVTYSGAGHSFTINTGEDNYYSPQIDGVNDNLDNIGNTTSPVETNTDNILSTMQGSNKLKEAELKLNIETAKLNATLGLENAKNLQKITKVLDSLLKATLSNTLMVAEQNRISEASQILQSEQYIVSSEIRDQLKEIVKSIKEQKLELNANSISMGNLNIDTESIVNAINSRNENQVATNAKIVENLTKQNSYYDFYNNGGLSLVSENLTTHTETLNKESEKLDFEKDGLSTLKDSSGNVIKPREVQALKNAESYIEQKETNSTTFDDIKDFVSNSLGIVEDGLESALGSTDGFSLNFNPLEYIDNILKEDFEQEKNKLNK
ncbi:hypothetical protein [Arcobacter aquimarinus]|uniref:hypothetical protein n=1 Tax=Arcobacter aquimarinus TaxID=1315211 RepID=UPI003BAF5B36